jgi:hypothetical protein
LDGYKVEMRYIASLHFILDYGLWIMDYGLWIMDYGLWIMMISDRWLEWLTVFSYIGLTLFIIGCILVVGKNKA